MGFFSFKKQENQKPASLEAAQKTDAIPVATEKLNVKQQIRFPGKNLSGLEELLSDIPFNGTNDAGQNKPGYTISISMKGVSELPHFELPIFKSFRKRKDEVKKIEENIQTFLSDNNLIPTEDNPLIVTLSGPDHNIVTPTGATEPVVPLSESEHSDDKKREARELPFSLELEFKEILSSSVLLPFQDKLKKIVCAQVGEKVIVELLCKNDDKNEYILTENGRKEAIIHSPRDAIVLVQDVAQKIRDFRLNSSRGLTTPLVCMVLIK